MMDVRWEREIEPPNSLLFNGIAFLWGELDSSLSFALARDIVLKHYG